MIRILFFAITSMMTSYSYAATSISFAHDGAIVEIQGQAGDLDAFNLFNAMNVPPVENNVSSKKTILFTNSKSQALFNLDCELLKSPEKSGVCTLRMNNLGGAIIDPVAKEMALIVKDQGDAKKLSPLFAKPNELTGIVYFSNDNHLGISLGITPGVEMVVIQYDAN